MSNEYISVELTHLLTFYGIIFGNISFHCFSFLQSNNKIVEKPFHIATILKYSCYTKNFIGIVGIFSGKVVAHFNCFLILSKWP